jgi:hypothetical protein
VATELLKPPVPGEVWVDGLDHGREWLVEAVSEQTVYLVMLHDGQRTPNQQDASERPGGGGYPQQVLRVGDVALICECYDEPDYPSVTAEYIATFDPPTVRALIAAALDQRDAA